MREVKSGTGVVYTREGYGSVDDFSTKQGEG